MSADASLELSAKRIRTRSRLVEAAAILFGERGFHGATLAQVAERAGLTTGAVYGNFKSKEDLFLAIFDAPAAGVQPSFDDGAPLRTQLRRIGEAVIAFLPAARARGVLFAEFQTYVQTHPAMQAKVEQRTRANAERLVGTWKTHFDETELGMPLETFVVVVDALIDGLISQRLLTPSVVTDAMIVAAFEALA